MSIFHRQGPGGEALGRLRQSAWRYAWLLAVAALGGALLGYGWAAHQPTIYEGVSRAHLAFYCPPTASCQSRWGRAQQLLSSSTVLQRAVELSGSRISAERLRQGLEVDVAQDTAYPYYSQVEVITIRVVDSTAKGAAQLANAVSLASRQVVAEQQDAAARRVAVALARRQRQLEGEIDALDHQLAADRGNRRLQADREARLQELKRLESLRRSPPMYMASQVWLEQAAIPAELLQLNGGLLT